MGGMDDMNAPMPPMDAEQDMPPEDDQMPPGGDEMSPGGDEEPKDPIAGGPDDDPLAGDPNALSAGEGNDEITQKYQKLSPDQQKAADKYIDSMINDDDQAGGESAAPPQMESRFSFKHIIDEIFGERDGNVNPLDKRTTRNEKMVNQESITDGIDPYMPR